MNAREMFENLSAIDLSDYIYSKNGLDYCPWSQIHKVLAENLNDGFIIQVHEGECGESWVECPDGSCLVSVTLTIGDRAHTCHLPVLDHKSKPILKPSCFDLNKAHQRAFVKAAAMHGLGLQLWTGEEFGSGEVAVSPERVDAIRNECISAFPTLDPVWKKLPAAEKEDSRVRDIFKLLTPLARAEADVKQVKPTKRKAAEEAA